MELPTDFSDRLSPMLVKELRQGLRTRTFISAFLLLQGFMIFTMFVATSTDEANAFLSGLFWFLLSVTLLFVMPLRGINALSSERKQNTLELIYVTQLSAFRIVAGKWAAIFSLSLLLTIAVLPYVILRYFLGGVDLMQDLLRINYMLLGSAVLTAFTVGVSAYPSVLLRTLLFGGIAIFSWSVVPSLLMISQFSGSMYLGNMALIITLVTILSIFFCYYFLAMGATRIAPVSENHSIKKRLFALLILVLSLLAPQLGLNTGACVGIAVAILILVLIDALTETAAVSRSIMRDFVATRFLPTRAAFLLAPGWHTGILFFVTIMTITFTLALLFIPDLSGEEMFLPTAVILFSLLLFPLFIIQLFFRKTANIFNIYLFIQAVSACMTMVITVASLSLDSQVMLWPFCFIPSIALSIIIANNDSAIMLMALHAVILLIALVFCYLRARPLYTQMIANIHQLKKQPTDISDSTVSTVS